MCDQCQNTYLSKLWKTVARKHLNTVLDRSNPEKWQKQKCAPCVCACGWVTTEARDNHEHKIKTPYQNRIYPVHIFIAGTSLYPHGRADRRVQALCVFLRLRGVDRSGDLRYDLSSMKKLIYLRSRAALRHSYIGGLRLLDGQWRSQWGGGTLS